MNEKNKIENEICSLFYYDRELNLNNCLKCPIKPKKICVRCKNEKPFRDFIGYNNRVCRNCKSCREYYIKKRRENRKKKQTKTKICHRCKSKKPINEFIGINNRECRNCKSCREYASKRSKEYYYEKRTKKIPTSKLRKKIPTSELRKIFGKETNRCYRCLKQKHPDEFIGINNRVCQHCKSCREDVNKKSKENYYKKLRKIAQNPQKIETKICKKCKQSKSIKLFNPNSEYCKLCKHAVRMKIYSKIYRKKYFEKPVKEVIPIRKHIYENKYFQKMYKTYGNDFCYTCEKHLGDSWIEFVNLRGQFLFNEILKIWQPYCIKCFRLHILHIQGVSYGKK